MRSKICDLEGLRRIVSSKKALGMTVGATSGCFDILHAGHVMYLEEARSLCDILIVLLNSDESVRGLKGEGRPVNTEEDRATVLSALESVDAVHIFDGATPCGIYADIQPDIIIKGGDYRGRHIPEMDTAASYGGSVVYASLLAGRSSTGIIGRIAGLAR